MSLNNILNTDSRQSSGKPYEAPTEEHKEDDNQLTAEQIAEQERLASEQEAENKGEGEGLDDTKTPEQVAEEEAAAKKKQEELDARTPEQVLADEEAAKKAEEDAATEKKSQEDAIAAQEAEFRAKYIKSLGFETEEAFTAKLNEKPVVVETEEQKLARETKYNTDLFAYAMQNNLISTADISALETVSRLSDEEIAFNTFRDEYRSSNKDRKIEGTDTPDPVDDDEIQEEFDNLYHKKSNNPVLKAIAEKNMKRIADDARGETQSKLDHAKQKFDAHLHKETNVPAFESFLKSTITSSIGEVLEVENGEQPFKFKLTNAEGKPLYDVAEIEKALVNSLVYQTYLKEEAPTKPELAKYVANEVREMIYRQNRAAINKELAEFNFEQGTKKGAIGAKSSFQEKKEPKPVLVDNTKMTPEQTARMANRYGKLV